MKGSPPWPRVALALRVVLALVLVWELLSADLVAVGTSSREGRGTGAYVDARSGRET